MGLRSVLVLSLYHLWCTKVIYLHDCSFISFQCMTESCRKILSSFAFTCESMLAGKLLSKSRLHPQEYYILTLPVILTVGDALYILSWLNKLDFEINNDDFDYQKKNVDFSFSLPLLYFPTIHLSSTWCSHACTSIVVL